MLLLLELGDGWCQPGAGKVNLPSLGGALSCFRTQLPVAVHILRRSKWRAGWRGAVAARFSLCHAFRWCDQNLHQSAPSLPYLNVRTPSWPAGWEDGLTWRLRFGRNHRQPLGGRRERTCNLRTPLELLPASCQSRGEPLVNQPGCVQM